MKKNSMAFKLVIAVVLIFIIMIIVTNVAMNKAYQYSALKLTKQFEMNLEKSGALENVVIVFNDAYNTSIFDFKWLSIIVIGIMSLIGGGIFYLLINRMLKPLDKLTMAIKNIDVENIHENTKAIESIKGSTEITDLTHAFNQAIDKIYKNYKEKKEFSQNVAHELKTPVAIIRAKLELEKKNKADDPFIQSLDKNVDRLQQLIDSMLILSDSKSIEFIDTDIKAVADELALDFENIYNDKVNFNIDGELNIKTDVMLVQRAIYNLMDNAIKYSIGDEAIEIIMDDEKKTFEIRNKGNNIDEEELTKIFDIFYRSDKSRSRETGGYGIGLAIVKNVLNKLNANIVAKNIEGGMSFKIYF